MRKCPPGPIGLQTAAQITALVNECEYCAAELPLGPRPIFRIDPAARILIASQAPGLAAHRSGIPFEDASGERLREWMGISKQEFFDSRKIAILPMGLCYPGRGSYGDLPPLPVCAPRWQPLLLGAIPNIRLTLAIGRYAQRWHLPGPGKTISSQIERWYVSQGGVIPLPHPSPVNNTWLKKHPWFEAKVLPKVKALVSTALN